MYILATTLFFNDTYFENIKLTENDFPTINSNIYSEKAFKFLSFFFNFFIGLS